MKRLNLVTLIVLGITTSMAVAPDLAADGPLVLGGQGRHCGEDDHCVNRLHPSIPMIARAEPLLASTLASRRP